MSAGFEASTSGTSEPILEVPRRPPNLPSFPWIRFGSARAELLLVLAEKFGQVVVLDSGGQHEEPGAICCR